MASSSLAALDIPQVPEVEFGVRIRVHNPNAKGGSLMRKVFAVAVMALVVVAAGGLFAEDKKAPEEIVYEAKPGNVTFPHAKHVEAVKNDCKTCHDALFQQAKGNLGDYKAGMHKKAEEAKTACGACHHEGGKSFPSKGNCNKCHVK